MSDVDGIILVPASIIVAVLGWAVSRLIAQVDRAIEDLCERVEHAEKTHNGHETRLALLEAGIRRRRGEGE